VDALLEWMKQENPEFDPAKYGFQQFAEFLNFAQDKTVVRVEPEGERLTAFLGAEFYPPAPPSREEEPIMSEYDEKQPIVPGQPSIFEPTPPPAPEPKPAKRPRVTRKRTGSGDNMGNTAPRSTTKKRAPRKKPPTG